MPIQKFHQDLLGRLPTETQQGIYRAGLRAVPGRDPDSLVAAIVLALWLGRAGEQVYLLVPADQEDALVQQIQLVFRYCVRQRKQDLAAVKAMKKAFGSLAFGSKVFTIHEPPSWVAVGWEGLLTPDWFSRRIARTIGV